MKYKPMEYSISIAQGNVVTHMTFATGNTLTYYLDNDLEWILIHDEMFMLFDSVESLNEYIQYCIEMYVVVFNDQPFSKN